MTRKDPFSCMCMLAVAYHKPRNLVVHFLATPRLSTYSKPTIFWANDAM